MKTASGRRLRSPDHVAPALMTGFVLDAIFADPRRWHPVAGFGNTALWLERYTYRSSRIRGFAHECMLVGSVVALALVAQEMAERRGLGFALRSAATWTVLGGSSLEREALAIHAHLKAQDLPAARMQVRNLVGRDPEHLTADEIARACIESVAENCSDAVVAPLVWGAIAGTPGLLGYRAINTLDAMVGHRTARYHSFGWAAARIDDLANWIPARLAAAMTALAAPLVGGSPGTVVALVRRDAGQHPSPNAGQVETAFAAALNIRLGGENVYDGAIEHRGVLGDGEAARPDDILRAVRLARLVSLASLAAVLSSRFLVRAAMRQPR